VSVLLPDIFLLTGEESGQARVYSVARPTESDAMERLHPRGSGKSIGRWYLQYLGIVMPVRVIPDRPGR